MAGLLAVRWARREDTRHEQRLLVGVQPRIDRLAIELHVLLDLRLAVGIVLVVEIDGDRVEAGRHAAATVRRHRRPARHLTTFVSVDPCLGKPCLELRRNPGLRERATTCGEQQQRNEGQPQLDQDNTW